MKRVLLGCRGREVVGLIGAETVCEPEAVRGLIEDGQIPPGHALRPSHETLSLTTCNRHLRAEAFSTAADPFHWMHLLGGLRAMALLRLDRVISIIAGSDTRKPDLLPAAVRHRMGRGVLRLFSPLFAFSPIALDGTLDGGAGIFRILQLNHDQGIGAFCIAGTDHRHRDSPETGRPETIQQMEDGVTAKLFGHDGRMNSVSVIILGGGPQALAAIDTFLSTESLQEMPCGSSSTSVREAPAGSAEPEALAMLPHRVFSCVRRLGLYAPASASPDGQLLHGPAL